MSVSPQHAGREAPRESAEWPGGARPDGQAADRDPGG